MTPQLQTYEGTVLEDPNDPESLILQFPDELIKKLGWGEGDELTWDMQPDGSIIMTRPTEWVLVECVSTFRERYMVEVPRGKSLWALDTVTCDDAKEFSQCHIGEQIVSHRVVTEEDALALADTDNEYAANWTTDDKKKAFFTSWSEQQK